MKLPSEQETEAVKCRHCSKFFLSKNYLARHYQRHHPEVEFDRLFEGDRSLNEREHQTQQ